MRSRGIVKFYSGGKRFGFIASPDGDIYCNADQLDMLAEKPARGDVVEFDIEAGAGRKTRAVNIRVILAADDEIED